MSQNIESRQESAGAQDPVRGRSSDVPEPGQETPTSAPRLLRRSKQDRVIAGVCGGLGRYLDVDPVLFRIAFLVSLLAGGVGLIVYIIFWIAVPEVRTPEEEDEIVTSRPVDRGRAGLIAGGTLILLGALILMRELFPWFDTRVLGAMILIGIGAFVLIRGLQRD